MSKVIKRAISRVILENYMPYAVSVIEDRAIVSIDGMKPVHRRILYSMYKDGLIDKDRVKSAKAVGNVLKYHPHGDGAVYETLTRLGQPDSLLLTLIDGKGNFGEHTSSVLVPAHMRYTECRLQPIVKEMFNDLDKLDILMCPNFDESCKEPMVLPISFPHILANPSKGIAVGIASNICSFNLNELCDTTIAFMNDENINLLDYLLAPDFPTGGTLLYNEKVIKQIYETGEGSIKLRANYTINESENTITINEIPYTTTREKIIDGILELVKNKTITEISDINDLTDLDGMRIEITYKKNTDVDNLIKKLYKYTKLEDTYSCSFIVLLQGKPQLLNIKQILKAWVNFRIGCLKQVYIVKKQMKIKENNIIVGYSKIVNKLDDIISTLRQADTDRDMLEKLITKFDLNEEQAQHIINMKFRNINQKFLENKLKELESVQKEIENLNSIINDENKIKAIIKEQLLQVKKKYGSNRRTIIQKEYTTLDKEEMIEEYSVKACITKQGYFKKIKASGYREKGSFNMKENDKLNIVLEGDNKGYILLFTDKFNVYKKRLNDFKDLKMSQIGEYLPNLLGLEEDEHIKYAVTTNDFSENLIVAFKNGKIAQIPLTSYNSSRTKVVKAYSNDSEVINLFKVRDNEQLILTSTIGKVLVVNCSDISVIDSKNTKGVMVMKSKNESELKSCCSTNIIDKEAINLEYYLGSRNSIGKYLRNKVDEIIFK